VQLVPAKEYNGPPIGNSYDVRVYVGEWKKLADFLELNFLEHTCFKRKTSAPQLEARCNYICERSRNECIYEWKKIFLISSRQLHRNKNSKHLYRI